MYPDLVSHGAVSRVVGGRSARPTQFVYCTGTLDTRNVAALLLLAAYRRGGGRGDEPMLSRWLVSGNSRNPPLAIKLRPNINMARRHNWNTPLAPLSAHHNEIAAAIQVSIVHSLLWRRAL